MHGYLRPYTARQPARATRETSMPTDRSSRLEALIAALRGTDTTSIATSQRSSAYRSEPSAATSRPSGSVEWTSTSFACFGWTEYRIRASSVDPSFRLGRSLNPPSQLEHRLECPRDERRSFEALNSFGFEAAAQRS